MTNENKSKSVFISMKLYSFRRNQNKEEAPMMLTSANKDAALENGPLGEQVKYPYNLSSSLEIIRKGEMTESFNISMLIKF